MEKKYRIKELPKSVPPMWKLEELTHIGHVHMKGWRIVCLSANRSILQGVLDDIQREATEEHNGLRKQS